MLQMKSLNKESIDLDLLQKNGKTFYWASHFLDQESLQAASRLYSICRRLDDLADDTMNDESLALNTIYHAVKYKDKGVHPLADEMIEYHARYKAPMYPFLHLIEGMIADQQIPKIASQSELQKYTYQVAGTVGILMASLLGATQDEAVLPAQQLGMAMQMTNIARDVVEDAAIGRRYLPIELDVEELLAPDNEQLSRLQETREALIANAEQLYSSGLDGLKFMSFRRAICIYVAAVNYRAIGHKIVRYGRLNFNKRVSLNTFEKFLLTCRYLPQFFMQRFKSYCHSYASSFS